MAAAAAPFLLNSSTQKESLKHLSETRRITSVPSNYTFSSLEPNNTDATLAEALPTIDFSLLTSGNPDQRFQVVQDLRTACREWGFFMVINHGVPESLRKRMLDACRSFFDLKEEEKREYAGKHVLDPIRCGTSVNPSVDKVLYWRDFIKIFVHPDFHSPDKPASFREVSSEYSSCIREMTRELLTGISESLGLEECYIDKAMELDSGFQILIANFYPQCPEPELALGLPTHSDHGLLTVLTEDNGGGLQIMHKGKWVQSKTIPNSFLVNIGDQMEILSNGIYKSVLHRAVVNNRTARISIVMVHGPPLETLVTPALQLVDNEYHPPAYQGMKYKDYMEMQQSNRLDGKSCLDRIRR